MSDEAQQRVRDWYDEHAGRADARRRAQADTSKLVVTFALAIAATLVATGLQVDPRGHLDTIGVVLLGLAFLFGLAVISLDRMKELDVDAVDRQASAESWNDEQRLHALRAASRVADGWNERVVGWVVTSTWVTVLLILGTGTVAAVSLLTK